MGMNFSQTTLAKASAIMGVSVESILSKDRHRKIAHARQAVAYTLRLVKGTSYPQIGRVLKRDHSTVMHAANVCGDRAARGGEFAGQLAQLVSEVQALKARNDAAARAVAIARARMLPMYLRRFEVCDLANLSSEELSAEVKSGRMPGPRVIPGLNKVFDRDEVLAHLGLLEKEGVESC